MNNYEYRRKMMDHVLESIDWNVVNKEKEKYKNSKGLYVPRVTDIISKTDHHDELMSWANYIGFKHIDYKETLNSKALIGTITHNAIENFLKNGVLPSNPNPAFNSFYEWWKHMNKIYNIEVIETEFPVVGDLYGGTVDAILRINGSYQIFDWKTSNRLRYSYFLQLAAYDNLLCEVYPISGWNIVIFSKDIYNPSYNSYSLFISSDLEYMNKCSETFFSMLYTYYNIYEINKGFSRLFNV